MQSRDRNKSVMVPTGRVCVALVSVDVGQGSGIEAELAQLGGTLLTFSRSEDLMCNRPVDRVVLVVLDGREGLSRLNRALGWLRRQAPRCGVLVVGDEGGGEEERLARCGGAMFLVRPVRREDWRAMLGHVLAREALPPVAVRKTANRKVTGVD